jgi:hypothetical protein
MSTEFDRDPIEELIRARMTEAVSNISVDAVGLVGPGLELGRRYVHGRRLWTAGAGAIVALALVGGLSYAQSNDLLGNKDPGPTHQNTLVELEAATPRGLAAAVMTHTADLGTPIAVAGKENGAGPHAVLTTGVAYRLDGGIGIEIDVLATAGMAQWSELSCHGNAEPSGMTTCDSFELPDGTHARYFEYPAAAGGGSTPAAAVDAVAVKRGDQVVIVVQSVSGSTDFVLSRDQLAAIAADPVVGLSTTAELNADGDQIADFKDGDLVHREVSHGSGTASAPAP